MSRKSVVTIRRGHMMNATFDRLGTYLCGVDAFIEVSTELFLPHLSNLPVRNEFTALLYGACSGYVWSRENRSMLREIREPVWSYIIDCCRSLATRDCNAAFSQIFQERTFGYPSEEEESLFTSSFRLG